ncbi:hypothetical protein [Mycoplasmopsis glycophila]|uniref:hypothetical protein n=1 Tax=Mycoplasmopsis glycophila TaxID=171285 RepID=UPI000487B164|nr:hypothetical protein [Mycoplasmopsis glycophila]
MHIKNQEEFILLIQQLKRVIDKFYFKHHNLYVYDKMLFQTKSENIEHLIRFHYISMIYGYIE